MSFRIAITLVLLFAASASAQTTVDLGDLNISASRVPQFYPATVAETTYAAAQSWPEYDVTCECINDSCVADDTGVGGCTPSSGTIPFRNSWGCSEADPADTGTEEDHNALECIIGAVPNNSVVFIPDGTYRMGDSSNEILTVRRSNVVIRGESRTGTKLVAWARLNGNGDLVSNSSGQPCGGDIGNCRSGMFAIGPYNSYKGASVSWDSGYEENATLIGVANAASFTVGGWIALEMTCSALVNSPTGDATRALTHLAKITAINTAPNPDEITLDRGLRMDYDDHGCEGAAIAKPYNPLSKVGIENIRLTTDTIALEHIGESRGSVAMAGLVESWIVDSDLYRWGDEVTRFTESARNWIQGNRFDGLGNAEISFSTEGIHVNRGSSDNVIENNYVTNFSVVSKANGGTEGTVFGYNYMRGGTPALGVERSLFNHGMYTRETLWEGNDSDAPMLYSDVYWGTHGKGITVYRNRVVGTSNKATINANRDLSGGGVTEIGSHANVIGNMAYFFITTPICQSGYPDCTSSVNDVDYEQTYGWYERNIFRNTIDCTGDPTSNACGWRMDAAGSTTSCGTGEGDCLSQSGPNGRFGNNYAGNVKSGVIATDTNIPDSLYRTEAPSWWCTEACTWDAMGGVGAWGDNYAGTLCQIPAEILSTLGECTTGTSEPEPDPEDPPAAGGGSMMKGGGASGGSLSAIEVQHNGAISLWEEDKRRMQER